MECVEIERGASDERNSVGEESKGFSARKTFDSPLTPLPGWKKRQLITAGPCPSQCAAKSPILVAR